MSQYSQTFDLKTNVGHCDLYFMVHWVRLTSRSLFDVLASYFGIMSQYDLIFDLKCRSLWPIFHGSLITWRLWCMNIILWDYELYDLMFDLKINVGHCDLYFLVHWFCLISWRLFDVWTSYCEIMSEYDPTFDLKINIGLCDLYFMVQWFCLLSWRLFDVWTSLFGIMSQYDPKFDHKTNVGHGLVILPDISKIIWWMSAIFSDNETVWPKLWPQNRYRSTWPIFHCLVILLNSFNIIWWMNIIVVVMDQCDTEICLIKYM